MKTSILKNAFLVLTIVLLLTSCNKDKKQGIKSIEGTWNVKSILSIYGGFDIQNNVVVGTNETERVDESGDLGQFSFGEKNVEYNFTRNDTVYHGNSTWELQLEKVNSGFTKANQWKLIVANEFTFDVVFDDDTKNAEKKAKNIEFENWPLESGNGVAFLLKLQKK